MSELKAASGGIDEIFIRVGMTRLLFGGKALDAYEKNTRLV